jgi:gamma-glutamylputrescine oxidase
MRVNSGRAHPHSLWAATANASSDRPPLEGDRSCDVCVIGGGYTGLSAALHLAQRGYDVVLLEAHRVGWGASGRNGGQLGSAHAKLQQTLVEGYGTDTARALWDLAEDAKALVKKLIDEHEIECDYAPGNTACAVTPLDFDYFCEHVDIAGREYGYEAYKIFDRAEIAEISGSACYAGAICDPTAGYLHPLNLSLGIAEAAECAGAVLCEASAATEIVRGKSPGESVEVKTASGSVRAKYVAIGCNGYIAKLWPEIATRVIAVDNYQLATAPLSDDLYARIITNRSCLWDSHFQVYYYSLSPDKRLVFGGGVGYPGREPSDMKSVVRKHMLKVYPQLAGVEIDYAWGGTLSITLGQMPDFGRLGDNVFYAQGYTGHGVGLATLGGQLLADVVAGTAERFDVLAGVPQRKFPGGAMLRGPTLALGFFYYWLRDRLRDF